MARKRVYRWVSQFSPEDRQSLRDLLNAIVATTGTNGYSSPLTLDEVTRLTDSLERKIAADTAAHLLVYEEVRVIATCTIERFPQPDRRHVLDIKRVAILPERQGTFLIEGTGHVLERCESMGGEIMTIDVSEDGPYALWERLGFKTFGTMQDYARVGERRLAGYYMAAEIRDVRERMKRFQRKPRQPERA